jgi:hypothetical protein
MRPRCRVPRRLGRAGSVTPETDAAASRPVTGPATDVVGERPPRVARAHHAGRQKRRTARSSARGPRP